MASTTAISGRENSRTPIQPKMGFSGQPQLSIMNPMDLACTICLAIFGSGMLIGLVQPGIQSIHVVPVKTLKGRLSVQIKVCAVVPFFVTIATAIVTESQLEPKTPQTVPQPTLVFAAFATSNPCQTLTKCVPKRIRCQ